MIFVDTGVWFALFVPGDLDHAVIQAWLDTIQAPLLTTDYVIDELLTLLRARGHRDRAISAGIAFFNGSLAILHSVERVDLIAGWDTFRKFRDKDWSFTDCVSYAVIDRLGVRTAASFDHHFHQFGTLAVVP